MKRTAFVGVLGILAFSGSAFAQLTTTWNGGRIEHPQGDSPTKPATPRDGPFIYNQPPDVNIGIFADGVPGQFYDQRIADDFTLAVGSTVNGVCWQGGSEFFVSPDILPNIDSFTLGFYSDAGGAPGADLNGGLMFIPLSSITVNAFGQDPNGAIAYDFCVKLEPFNLPAGRFWFTTGANLIDGGATDAFVWYNTSPVVNDLVAAQLPVDAAYQTFSGFGDMAFQIQAPEPATIGLLGLGVVGLLRRRK